MSDDTQEVQYRDPKAEKIPDFGSIANFMWRRANYMLQDAVKSNAKIRVLDPCAGGGLLLAQANKGFELVAYENDYESFWYCAPFLTAKGFVVNNSYTNGCFESHFADPFGPEFNLVISIPYTDRQINGKYETDPSYLKIGNYAFYVMARSMDVLLDKGIGVFCVPLEYREKKYQEQVDYLLTKADILSIESYGDVAIAVLQKK